MASGEIRIRAGRPADSGRCQEIAVAAWRPIHAVRRDLLGPVIYEHLNASWEGAKAGQIDRSFRTRPEWTRVAVVGGSGRGDGDGAGAGEGAEEIAGFVTFHLREAQQIGVIGNNAVDPAWARRGIATALYRHVLDVFRAAGMRIAQVGTGLDAGHAPALAAYRKIGFTAEIPSVTLYQEL